MGSSARDSVVVIGQIARDLVLRVEKLLDSEGSSAVLERLEQLGGKGANQAVGLQQLGADVVLIGTLGEDDIGHRMLDEAMQSGLDIRCVKRRGNTALFVAVIDEQGQRRLFEDIPQPALVTEADVYAAAVAFETADTVCLQLQQPPETLLAAARLARDYGARVALDGGIEGIARDELLRLADVIRADAQEAEMLSGVRIERAEHAVRAAELVLEHGPSVVAFAVPKQGDLVAWPGGNQFFPHKGGSPVDITGAGDAFFAGLVVGLRRGYTPAASGQLAAAAAASTVAHLGGRPDLGGLSPDLQ